MNTQEVIEQDSLFMKFIGMLDVKKASQFFSDFLQALLPPVIAIILFLVLWSAAARNIVTSLGNVPGPLDVAQQFGNLIQEHKEERVKAKEFKQRQDVRNSTKLANDPNAVIKDRKYTGKPTFFDQIITSLTTVFTGFLLASLIAVPLGIICGLSKGINQALNPLIQIFKPVSPLAWLPLVTMIVSAVYVSESPMFEKAFITSAIQ